MQASLDCELPERLAVGGGTALYLYGGLSVDSPPIAVEVALGESRTRVTAHGMPSPGSLGAGDRWWAILPIAPIAAVERRELALEVRLADGSGHRAVLGTVELNPSAPRVRERWTQLPEGGQPLIAVCMATYNPDPAYFERQIASIRGQSWERWVCCLSDDASEPESFAEIERLVGDDERFLLSRSERNLGFYRNFERALSMAPAEAELIAPADQDDRWDRDKLEALHATLVATPGAQLAYSDMRILTDSLDVVSDTYWFIRRNNYTDMGSMLVANTVTGAASMIRRDLLADAMPFPPGPGEAYHDHWLALCALAQGEIAYLDRPTYDHVRHAMSVTVQAQHAWARRPRNRRERYRMRWRRLRARAFRPGWRAVYFERYLHLKLLIEVLELRLGDRITAPARRSMGLLDSAASRPRGLGWLVLRSFRPWFGRTETMARERVLLGGVLWLRLVRARSRLDRRADQAA